MFFFKGKFSTLFLNGSKNHFFLQNGWEKQPKKISVDAGTKNKTKQKNWVTNLTLSSNGIKKIKYQDFEKL